MVTDLHIWHSQIAPGKEAATLSSDFSFFTEHARYTLYHISFRCLFQKNLPFFGYQKRIRGFLCLKKGKCASFLVSKNCLSMFAQESTVVVNSSTSTPFFITSIGSLLFWTFLCCLFAAFNGLDLIFQWLTNLSFWVHSDYVFRSPKNSNWFAIEKPSLAHEKQQTHSIKSSSRARFLYRQLKTAFWTYC